jgi:cyclopropane fatty-acyl-phospholipid synthase-like methyltransferase
MFEELEEINSRPAPFSISTTEALWTDGHTSAQMLSYHLDPNVDLSSRNHAFIDRSADWIASRFELGEGVRVADFGCGPGLYTTRLAKTGAEVTGIDFSERSVAHARRTARDAGLSVDYIVGDYLDVETDARFDLITMIMCDFCALGPSQRTALVEKFHRLLTPGGAVLLDVYSLNAFAQREESATYEKNQLKGFWSASPYYAFVNTFKYDDQKVVLDKYTLIEEGRTRTFYNWLQCFNPEALEREVTRAGLMVEATLGNVAGDVFEPAADEFAIIARKPG